MLIVLDLSERAFRDLIERSLVRGGFEPAMTADVLLRELDFMATSNAFPWVQEYVPVRAVAA